MHSSSTRTVATLVLVGALVLTAGCTGILGEGATSNGTESTATETPLEGGTTTETPDAESSESTGGAESTGTAESGHDHGGDGHSHGGDGGDGANGNDGSDETNDTQTDDGQQSDEQVTEDVSDADTDGETGELNRTSAAAEGRITVVVEGSELNLRERDESGDRFGSADENYRNWIASESGITLANALSHYGVNATASQLTVDGTRYSVQNDGTIISYRVNGEPVDPEEATLEDGDQVWVTVETAEMDVSTPGEYLYSDQLHVHGGMTFTVDDHEVDFSKSRFQEGHDDHFHYEGGDGSTWHAHSWSVTLKYALDSLAGINVSADGETITYNGTTYDASESGTSIDVTVNGESVEPGEYYLKDGDLVDITVDAEG